MERDWMEEKVNEVNQPNGKGKIIAIVIMGAIIAILLAILLISKHIFYFLLYNINS